MIIDADQQKVTVSGCVDSTILIKKLVNGGKYAELWTQKTNQGQKQKNCIKDDKNNKSQNQNQTFMKGLEALNNKQKFPAFSSEEDDDDDYFDDEEDEEDELRFLREKANRLNVLKQQQTLALNNAKNGVGAITTNPNNLKMNNKVGNGNAGKKVMNQPNQNMGIDQNTLAALKMKNAHLGIGGDFNAGEAKRANDLSTMMNLASLGANSNGLPSGFQVQPNNDFQSMANSRGIPTSVYASGQYPSNPSSMMRNMNGYNQPSPMMNMDTNMTRQGMQRQPQMMYNRSPFVPPSTGYCHNYNPCPVPCSACPEVNYYGENSNSTVASAHMGSDENMSSCSIM